jgi:CheY-like chemotaxis protein
VLDRLRRDPRTRTIPVVAVTANAMQAEIDAAMAAGFADYLTKPFEIDHLVEVVTRLTTVA